jgi:MFS family permease
MTDPASSTPDARRALVRLCLAASLAYCSYAICRTPLLPLLARELGANPPMVGFVVGASTLTGIVLKAPAGAWSDVLGRRPLLVAGAMVFALMPFAYLGIASLGALVALRFLHGAATATFGPVASASLSDLAPTTRRATWLSTYSTVQGAGQALGPVLAGYLIASGRFDRAFVAAGLIGLAVPLIVMRWPGRGSSGASFGRRQQLARGLSEVVRDRLILVTSAAQAAQFMLNGTLNAFLPLFGRDVIGLSVAQIGWLFGLQTAATLVTRPLMGAVSDRIGRRGVIVSGLSLCSAAVLAISLAASFPMLLSAVLVYAVGVAITTAATSALVTDLAQRAQYGAAHGVFGTIYDVGDALGPILAGVLVANVGYTHMFQIMAATATTVAVTFHLQSRQVVATR